MRETPRKGGGQNTIRRPRCEWHLIGSSLVQIETGNLLHSMKPGRTACGGRGSAYLQTRGSPWMLEVHEGGSRPHVDNQAGIRYPYQSTGHPRPGKNGNKHVDSSVGLPGCAPRISNITIVSSADHG